MNKRVDKVLKRIEEYQQDAGKRKRTLKQFLNWSYYSDLHDEILPLLSEKEKFMLGVGGDIVKNKELGQVKESVISKVIKDKESFRRAAKIDRVINRINKLAEDPANWGKIKKKVYWSRYKDIHKEIMNGLSEDVLSKLVIKITKWDKID